MTDPAAPTTRHRWSVGDLDDLTLLDRAYEVIDDLCSGRRKWTMTVPPEPTDQDMILSEVLMRMRKRIEAEAHEHRWTASTHPGAAPGLPASSCADPDCPDRRSAPAEPLPPEDDDVQRRCWTIQGPDPISQCVFFNGHEGEHWFGTTEGRWVPEGVACCNLAAQVSHVQSQGGQIHLGLGERCEDNARSTPAGALDVERLRHALSLTKWWEHCGHIDSSDGWTTPQLAEAIITRLRSPESD